MLDAFVNPWGMAAGAALVSVPIAIHLINRLRFKKVHWAAMEFLLKAQKRMKRKLIIQQLLLLFLRCLMVFLLGLLVGRFLGFDPLKGSETRTTIHYAILDDSPSMSDNWTTEAGIATDSFKEAKRAIVEGIAPAAQLATNPQMIEVVRLSDPGSTINTDRVNATSTEQLKKTLETLEPSAVRGSLVEALKKAKTLVDNEKADVARVVHIVSDLRAIDWDLDGPALRSAIEALTKANVKVHLLDVASPYRKDEKRPQHHDNVAIMELSPSRRVVARNEPVEFVLRVKNYGVAELKDLRVTLSSNGNDNIDDAKSITIPVLAGNTEEQLRFKLVPSRIGSQEKPLERFTLVTARIATDANVPGPKFDDVRHAVVEVRDRLPILAIDGRPAEKDKKDGDSFYLRNIFTNVAGGYAWTPGTPADLDKLELKNYSAVYLMNVPSLSEEQAKKLEAYVAGGSGVGIFLGPDVKPAEYNAQLYKDGAGIMPVPLPEKPSEALPEEKVFEKLFNFQKKVLLRDKTASRHEALFNIYFNERGKEDKENAQGLEKFFNFVLVKQYWPIKRIGKWRDDPTVRELYCLPNEAGMGQYEPAALALMNRLPAEEPKYAKYKDVLNAMKVEIRKTASSTEPLFKLAAVLDRLLSDQISEGDAAEALLREFWALPENVDLRGETTRLRDAVKYGDPLYLAKTFGKGRVTLMTTTAGEQWTDWPAGPGGRSYPPVMTEMERYLAGGGSEDVNVVGSPITLKVDAATYKPMAGRVRVSFEPGKDKETITEDLKEQPLTTGTLNYTEGTRPGAYLFTLTKLKGSGDAAEVPEYTAVALNIDSAREGDLRRAGKDDLLQLAPGAGLHSLADNAWLDELKNKRTDLTEAGWLFLVLILILVVEQWLATKLSFHTGGGTVDTFAPSAAATFQKATAPVLREPTTVA